MTTDTSPVVLIVDDEPGIRELDEGVSLLLYGRLSPP